MFPLLNILVEGSPQVDKCGAVKTIEMTVQPASKQRPLTDYKSTEELIWVGSYPEGDNSLSKSSNYIQLLRQENKKRWSEIPSGHTTEV